MARFCNSDVEVEMMVVVIKLMMRKIMMTIIMMIGLLDDDDDGNNWGLKVLANNLWSRRCWTHTITTIEGSLFR